MIEDETKVRDANAVFREKTFPKGTMLAASTKSEAVFQRIDGWLETCLTSHQKCTGVEEPYLPTRVLAIGRKESDPISLLETRGARGRYVCLSWCWGKALPLTTTRDNIAALKANVPWSQLPPAFQDAIEISRHLGINYLWIDALCIVQGDKLDWEKESANMAEVYGNAFLTICAAATIDSQQHIFQDLPEDFTQHPLGETGVFLRTQIVHDSLFELSASNLNFTMEREVAPLFWRAWTFQEMLLSQRVLFYGSYEVAWRCRSEILCCCSSSPVVARQSSIHQSNRLFPFRLERAEENLGSFFERNIQILWEHLITCYTTKELTKIEDTLPALSGVCKKFQTVRKCRYFAGIWEDNLIEGLCWESRGMFGGGDASEFVEKRTSSSYVAPSWSWACHLHPVLFRTQIERLDKQWVDILEVSCTSASLDPTGSVSSAFIRMTGHLHEWYIHPERISNDRQEQFLQKESCEPTKRFFFTPDYHPTDLRNMFPTESKVFALQLFTHMDDSISRQPRYATLILRQLEKYQSPDPSLGAFERIGFDNVVFGMSNANERAQEFYLL